MKPIRVVNSCGALTAFLVVCLAQVALGAVEDGPLTDLRLGPQRTLVEMVAMAAPGDTLVLPAGEYREGQLVVIDKPLTIIGQPGATLYGSDSHGILLVTGDSVTISGLTFRDVGTSFMDDRAAITIEDAADCRVKSNTFIDNFFAIYVAKSERCEITENVVSATTAAESHSGNGIHLWYCRDMIVTDNTVSGHRDGIYFEFVEDSSARDNVSRDNLRYGLHFMFSDRCTYEGNTFTSNGAGVAVMYSEGIAVRGNEFSKNRGAAAYGLLLKEIDDATLAGNAFVDNSIGVYMEGSNRVRVEKNAFIRNGWALKVLANSEETEFVCNDFIGNTFDVATNSRRTVSVFRNNYWDEYRGYDLDGDSVGDVPFRPVRLFSLVVEQNEPSVVLLGSLFVDLLEMAEQLVPSITPQNLVDSQPSVNPQTAYFAPTRPDKPTDR